MNLFVAVTVVQTRRLRRSSEFFAGGSQRSPYDSNMWQGRQFSGFSFTLNSIGYGMSCHPRWFRFDRYSSRIDPAGPKINQMMIVRDE